MNYFINTVLSCLIMLVSCLSPAAANTFNLKVSQPEVLKQMAEEWQSIQDSILLRSLDNLFSQTSLKNLIFKAYNPRVAIIPPVSKKNRETAQSGKTSIKAITANMLLFPAPILFNQPERINEFAKAAKTADPDIIFMQEVWDNNSLSLLISHFPDYYAIFTPSIIYNSSGLLTLSRFPVIEASFKLFPIGLEHNSEELLASKGILCCRCQLTNNLLNLVNTHLYSAGTTSAYQPNQQQFKQLNKFVLGLDDAAIIGGDMNLLPDFIDPLLAPEIKRDQSQVPTAGLYNKTNKLDYLMIKSVHGLQMSLTAQNLQWPVRFSDHIALFGNIELLRP